MGGKPPRPGPGDHTRVAYLDVRDRFLTSWNDQKEHEVEWLVAVGRFVQDRWIAEDDAFVSNGDGDGEPDYDALWDLCDEKQLRDLRIEAADKLRSYLTEEGTRAAVSALARQFDPLRSLSRVVAWVGWEMLKGLVGGVGLIILGLLLVWLAPQFLAALREHVQQALPK